MPLGQYVCHAFKSENLGLHVAMDHFLAPTGALVDYVLAATNAPDRPDLTHMWGFRVWARARKGASLPTQERVVGSGQPRRGKLRSGTSL
jgi:hypothetical protein